MGMENISVRRFTDVCGMKGVRNILCSRINQDMHNLNYGEKN
jgi:hypothetical protein